LEELAGLLPGRVGVLGELAVGALVERIGGLLGHLVDLGRVLTCTVLDLVHESHVWSSLLACVDCDGGRASGQGSQALERPRPLMAETTKITRQAPTIEATTPQIENAPGIAPPSPLVKNETIQPTTKAPTTPDTMFAISPIWAFLPMIMEAIQPASPPTMIQAMMVPIVGVLSR